VVSLFPGEYSFCTQTTKYLVVAKYPAVVTTGSQTMKIRHLGETSGVRDKTTGYSAWFGSNTVLSGSGKNKWYLGKTYTTAPTSTLANSSNRNPYRFYANLLCCDFSLNLYIRSSIVHSYVRTFISNVPLRPISIISQLHCHEYSIFHIHVSVSDLYIPRIGPHIFLQQNRQTNRGNV